jgi:hypothetical protein
VPPRSPGWVALADQRAAPRLLAPAARPRSRERFLPAEGARATARGRHRGENARVYRAPAVRTSYPEASSVRAARGFSKIRRFGRFSRRGGSSNTGTCGSSARTPASVADQRSASGFTPASRTRRQPRQTRQKTTTPLFLSGLSGQTRASQAARATRMRPHGSPATAPGAAGSVSHLLSPAKLSKSTDEPPLLQLPTAVQGRAPPIRRVLALLPSTPPVHQQPAPRGGIHHDRHR